MAIDCSHCIIDFSLGNYLEKQTNRTKKSKTKMAQLNDRKPTRLNQDLSVLIGSKKKIIRLQICGEQNANRNTTISVCKTVLR